MRLAFAPAVAAFLWAAAVQAEPAAPTPVASSLTWDRAFPTANSVKDLHLVATFSGADGNQHTLELWRHGDAFLHRRTDQRLDLYVTAPVRSTDDYQYRFIDHHRHTVTDVGRANLYRIGVFSDWFGLAHVVERPKGAFTVRDVPKDDVGPRSDCSWRLLTIAAAGSTPANEARICWSSRYSLPLVIEKRQTDGKWKPQFIATLTERARFTKAELRLPERPEAYAAIDADQEINPHAGD